MNRFWNGIVGVLALCVALAGLAGSGAVLEPYMQWVPAVRELELTGLLRMLGVGMYAVCLSAMAVVACCIVSGAAMWVESLGASLRRRLLDAQ